MNKQVTAVLSLLSFLTVLLWLAGGAYLGLAGWVGSKALQNTSVVRGLPSDSASYLDFDGLTFKDERSLRAFLQERSSAQVFPWIFEIPQELTPLIACIGFGLFGGAGRLLKQLSLDKRHPSPLQLFSDPIFGAVIGTMVLFLSVVIPNLFVTGETSVRPETLVAFSLFGGVYSEQAYHWIEVNVVRLFTRAQDSEATKKDRGKS